MFPKYTKGQNDRPFASIILVIGEHDLDVSIQKQGGLKASNIGNQYYLVEPVTLVFKGLRMKNCLKSLHPIDFYHGMDPEHLEDCDRMYDLTQGIEDDNPVIRSQPNRRAITINVLGVGILLAI